MDNLDDRYLSLSRKQTGYHEAKSIDDSDVFSTPSAILPENVKIHSSSRTIRPVAVIRETRPLRISEVESISSTSSIISARKKKNKRKVTPVAIRTNSLVIDESSHCLPNKLTELDAPTEIKKSDEIRDWISKVEQLSPNAENHDIQGSQNVINNESENEKVTSVSDVNFEQIIASAVESTKKMDELLTQAKLTCAPTDIVGSTATPTVRLHSTNDKQRTADNTFRNASTKANRTYDTSEPLSHACTKNRSIQNVAKSSERINSEQLKQNSKLTPHVTLTEKCEKKKFYNRTDVRKFMQKKKQERRLKEKEIQQQKEREVEERKKKLERYKFGSLKPTLQPTMKSANSGCNIDTNDMGDVNSEITNSTREKLQFSLIDGNEKCSTDKTTEDATVQVGDPFFSHDRSAEKKLLNFGGSNIELITPKKLFRRVEKNFLIPNLPSPPPFITSNACNRKTIDYSSVTFPELKPYFFKQPDDLSKQDSNENPSSRASDDYCFNDTCRTHSSLKSPKFRYDQLQTVNTNSALSSLMEQNTKQSTPCENETSASRYSFVPQTFKSSLHSSAQIPLATPVVKSKQLVAGKLTASELTLSNAVAGTENEMANDIINKFIEKCVSGTYDNGELKNDKRQEDKKVIDERYLSLNKRDRKLFRLLSNSSDTLSTAVAYISTSKTCTRSISSFENSLTFANTSMTDITISSSCNEPLLKRNTNDNLNNSQPMSDVNFSVTGFSLDMCDSLIEDDSKKLREQFQKLQQRKTDLIAYTKKKLSELELRKEEHRVRNEDGPIKALKKKQRAILLKVYQDIQKLDKLNAVITEVIKDRQMKILSEKENIRKKKLVDKTSLLMRSSALPSDYRSTVTSTHQLDLVTTSSLEENSSSFRKEHVLPMNNSNLLKYVGKSKVDETQNAVKVLSCRENIATLKDACTSPASFKSDTKCTRSAKRTQNGTSSFLDVNSDSNFSNKENKRSVEKKCKETLSSNNDAIRRAAVSIHSEQSGVLPLEGEEVSQKLTESKYFNKTNTRNICSPVLPDRCIKEPIRRLSNFSDDSALLSFNESTLSEQSDVELKILALQEKLNERKLEANRLRRLQKQMRRDQLKAQEISLLKQIEAYDRYIQKMTNELSEADKSVVAGHVTKPQIKKPQRVNRLKETIRTTVNVQFQDAETQFSPSSDIDQKLEHLQSSTNLMKELTNIKYNVNRTLKAESVDEKVNVLNNFVGNSIKSNLENIPPIDDEQMSTDYDSVRRREINNAHDVISTEEIIFPNETKLTSVNSSNEVSEDISLTDIDETDVKSEEMFSKAGEIQHFTNERNEFINNIDSNENNQHIGKEAVDSSVEEVLSERLTDVQRSTHSSVLDEVSSALSHLGDNISNDGNGNVDLSFDKVFNDVFMSQLKRVALINEEVKCTAGEKKLIGHVEYNPLTESILLKVEELPSQIGSGVSITEYHSEDDNKLSVSIETNNSSDGSCTLIKQEDEVAVVKSKSTLNDAQSNGSQPLSISEETGLEQATTLESSNDIETNDSVEPKSNSDKIKEPVYENKTPINNYLDFDLEFLMKVKNNNESIPTDISLSSLERDSSEIIEANWRDAKELLEEEDDEATVQRSSSIQDLSNNNGSHGASRKTDTDRKQLPPNDLRSNTISEIVEKIEVQSNDSFTLKDIEEKLHESLVDQSIMPFSNFDVARVSISSQKSNESSKMSTEVEEENIPIDSSEEKMMTQHSNFTEDATGILAENLSNQLVKCDSSADDVNILTGQENRVNDEDSRSSDYFSKNESICEEAASVEEEEEEEETQSSTVAEPPSITEQYSVNCSHEEYDYKSSSDDEIKTTNEESQSSDCCSSSDELKQDSEKNDNKTSSDETSREQDVSVEELIEDHSFRYNNNMEQTFIVADEHHYQSDESASKEKFVNALVESILLDVIDESVAMKKIYCDSGTNRTINLNDTIDQIISDNDTPFLQALKRDQERQAAQSAYVADRVASSLCSSVIQETLLDTIRVYHHGIESRKSNVPLKTTILSNIKAGKNDALYEVSYDKNYEDFDNGEANENNQISDIDNVLFNEAEQFCNSLELCRRKFKEAEELRMQQIQIEQQIEEIESQQHQIPPYIFFREIPNKPPPPYTPPSNRELLKIPDTKEEVQRYIEKFTAVIYENLQNDAANLSHIQPPENTIIDGISDDVSIYTEFLFDLNKELIGKFYEKVNENNSLLPWERKSIRRVKYWPPVLKSREKLIEAIKVEALSLFGLKSKINRENFIITWSKRRRTDFVDEILINELQEEEAEWTCYEENEIVIKNKITENILDELIFDTALTIDNIVKMK